MKLPIAALILLTATSFATPAQAVYGSVLPEADLPDAEIQQGEEIQVAIVPQECLTCDSASSAGASAKQSRPDQNAQRQRQRRQQVRQQREQQRQRNAQQQERQRQAEVRRQQERQRQAQQQERQRQAQEQENRRNAQAQEQRRQEEARRQQQRERQEQERQEAARRDWQEERDRDRQEEAREDWREDRDRYYDHDYYDRNDYDHDDYDYEIWRRDRYDRYDWYQDSDDDWDAREQQEREREEARRNREHQAAVWRDWEERQNVLRWHWDTWQRTYRPSLVGTTVLELTSLDNNWTTVLIEGIDTAQEVSFTGSGVQTIYLSPGAYRIQFSPILSDDYWQSGYLVVGRTNRLRIMFDPNNESVQVFDDAAAWTPGDRLPGYPDDSY